MSFLPCSVYSTQVKNDSQWPVQVIYAAVQRGLSGRTPHQSNIMLIDTHIVISHPLFIHQSQGLMVDITGCPQAIRKRECCIGCEAILSRLTYSEEELGLQKKSMALVLVDVFHIRNFRKERNLKKKKPIKFSISKLEKDLFFLKKF